MPKIIYWDSACFLSYVNRDEERMTVLNTLIEASGRGEIHLYTSAISQTEVAYGASEQQRRELDPTIESLIDSLWANQESVTIVGYNSVIGRIARRMIRQAIPMGWSLKPIDAIHLATAQWMRSAQINAEEFHTYDRSLFKYADICGFPILEPYIEQPNLI